MSKIIKITFVCSGNICRSPFAEFYVNKLVSENTLQGFWANSAGTLGISGQKATEQALNAAMKLGVDLKDHLSKPVTPEIINGSDFIFVMENKHRETLISENRLLGLKIFLLGSFFPQLNKNGEIFDPIGLPLEKYTECYKSIIMSTQDMFKKLFNITI